MRAVTEWEFAVCTGCDRTWTIIEDEQPAELPACGCDDAEVVELFPRCANDACPVDQNEVEYPGDCCERCEKELGWIRWRESTEAAVMAVAKQHGWNLDDQGGGFNTRSTYFTFHRTNPRDDDEFQSIKIRISDHGSCYCNEDLSLAMNPSGDDHIMADIEAAFSAPFEVD